MTRARQRDPPTKLLLYWHEFYSSKSSKRIPREKKKLQRAGTDPNLSRWDDVPHTSRIVGPKIAIFPQFSD